MTIAAEATEAKSVTLLATCRNALAHGTSIRGQDIKDLLAQLESMTTNDLSGRTDVTPSTLNDGRDAVQAAVAIATEASEARAILLVASCREALRMGSDLKGTDLFWAIGQLEAASVATKTARVDIVPNTTLDGRNAAEVTVIT